MEWLLLGAGVALAFANGANDNIKGVAALTAGLATRAGLPVSTTHVSTGGIFGIGAAGGTLERPAAGEILAAWLGTLPVAAGVGALLAWAFA